MKNLLTIELPSERSVEASLALADICQYATNRLKRIGWTAKLKHHCELNPEEQARFDELVQGHAKRPK